MPSDAGSLATTPSRPPVRLERPALFLDLDGVLAPIEATHEAVVPTTARTALLKDLLERLDGRVAVVSGRAIADIDRILDGVVPCVAGIHGLERRRSDGRVERAATPPGVASALAEMTAFAHDRPGVIVEDKGIAAGLHYRLAPDQQGAVTAFGADLADRFDLVGQPGKMILELKARGADNGTALAAFMAEPPFAGARPVMVGDDLTDEFGFLAAARLGGFGVLVGEERDTAARFILQDDRAVGAWLSALEPTR